MAAVVLEKNRLAREKSPYLLQHADNPVDWFPWGPEAFNTAQKEHKPVFLSIGYSSCHWCHVMEQESFSDPEIAAVLNEVFVCIKVDKEERPDLDRQYMEICELMTGQGGWPLTIVMTPEKVPFLAATYIPNESKYGRPGIVEFAAQARRIWERRKDTIDQISQDLKALLEKTSTLPAASNVNLTVFITAFEQLKSQYDAKNGGFGGTPKFPLPSVILFLLRYGYREGADLATRMAVKTLISMQKGGIFDQIGSDSIDIPPTRLGGFRILKRCSMIRPCC